MSSVPSTVLGPDLRAALVAMVRKRVPESEVEDIVQSTLADAIDSPHAPEDAESLRRWIFGVAKNKVVDYHRRAGREIFDVPEVPGKPAPHAEADLLRWAEKHLPPGEENKTTLDWMLREGEGEKLEWIAETEQVPAPRVRQRVSRLRRHLKTHWQKEVTLLAAFGVLITMLVLFMRDKEPEPIANEDVPRGIALRKQGLEKCAAAEWKDCLEKLDAAKRLDPAGESQPAVKSARESANKAISLPPTPSTNLTPPPSPSPTTLSTETPSPSPVPSSSAFPMNDGKKSFEPWVDPTGAPPVKAPPAKPRPTAGMTKTSSGGSDTPMVQKSGAKQKSPPNMKMTGGKDFGGSSL